MSTGMCTCGSYAPCNKSMCYYSSTAHSYKPSPAKSFQSEQKPKVKERYVSSSEKSLTAIVAFFSTINQGIEEGIKKDKEAQALKEAKKLEKLARTQKIPQPVNLQPSTPAKKGSWTPWIIAAGIGFFLINGSKSPPKVGTDATELADTAVDRNHLTAKFYVLTAQTTMFNGERKLFAILDKGSCVDPFSIAAEGHDPRFVLVEGWEGGKLRTGYVNGNFMKPAPLSMTKANCAAKFLEPS